MAVPKERHSKARKRKHRAHHYLAPLPRSLCPRCNQPKRPHRVCGNCGYYRGRDILRLETS